MPYREVAQIAGCSEEAVKMRLHRARQQGRHLSAYIDDELSLETRREIEHQCDACPRCRTEFEAHQAVWEAAHLAQSGPAPKTLWEGIAARPRWGAAGESGPDAGRPGRPRPGPAAQRGRNPTRPRQHRRTRAAAPGHPGARQPLCPGPAARILHRKTAPPFLHLPLPENRSWLPRRNPLPPRHPRRPCPPRRPTPLPIPWSR
ncbi:MAG: zf-HC2 domain-containing protein [Candidatus Handelsmanbacteria bacterium]|nr:zf-HC2 domain-containing protein [Candidatus Handelsmanbacteria bacterium]